MGPKLITVIKDGTFDKMVTSLGTFDHMGAGGGDGQSHQMKKKILVSCNVKKYIFVSM